MVEEAVSHVYQTDRIRRLAPPSSTPLSIHLGLLSS